MENVKKQKILRILLSSIILIFVIIGFSILFSNLYEYIIKKNSEVSNIEFYKNQIEVYKDSILKLQAEREKDSVITVEVIKYVQVKEVDFKKNVSDLDIEQPKKDTLIMIFDEVKDTLIDIINVKDSLLYKQEQILGDLYLFSETMNGQIERDAIIIVDLQKQLYKSKKKSITRGWVIGGMAVVGAAAIVTAILVK